MGRGKNEFNSALSCFLSFSFFLHLQDIMNSEKSYDSLPNFTAADCESPRPRFSSSLPSFLANYSILRLCVLVLQGQSVYEMVGQSQ